MLIAIYQYLVKETIFYRLNTLTPDFLPFTGLQTAKLPQIRHSV